MGGIVEKPSGEVGRSVEKGWKKLDEGEIRNAGADIATGKEDEASKGGFGVGICGGMFLPAPTDENVGGEGKNVESDHYIDGRDEIGEVCASHDEKTDEGEKEDFGVILRAGHTIEVDNLGNEENHKPDDRGVVAGEKTVGDKSSHHGELQEVIFGESADTVN